MLTVSRSPCTDLIQDIGEIFFEEMKWEKDVQILISGAYLMKLEAPCSISHHASKSPSIYLEISDQLLEPNPQM